MESPQNAPAPEYTTAFRAAKRAKNLCMFALFLAIALQGGSFVAVRFFGVIDANQKQSGPRVTTAMRAPDAPVGVTAPTGEKGPTEADAAKAKADAEKAAKAEAKAKAKVERAAKAKAKAAASKSKAAAAVAEPTNDQITEAIIWQSVMSWVLHATKLLAPILAMLLIAAILFAVCISLIGRLGGIAGLVGAFFWAVVLLALLMPWQGILQDRFACGAMYDLDELIANSHKVMTAWGASTPSQLDEHLYYARFAGLPGIALLVWLTVALKFACGCKGAAGVVRKDQDAQAGGEGQW